MKIQYQFLALLLYLLPHILLADVKLNALFSDHMVVQRNTEIPIWGWADSGEKITINASWGEIANAIANDDGTWQTTLKTPKAGGPFSLIIAGNNTIIINDVLSGEVWLCTGQSNMDFAMEKFIKDSREAQYQPLVEYMRNEVATVHDDWLRHIEVPQTTSLFEMQLDFKDNWRSADSNGIHKITATGYFFAKELRKHLDVPIGLVECAWGGTRIQPWLSEEAYRSDEHLEAYFEAARNDIEETIKLMDAKDYLDTRYHRKLAEWKENDKRGREPRPSTHPRDDRQLPATDYNGMLSTVIPYAIKGAIWYQGESNAVYLPDEYGDYLSTMIKSWRSDWGQGDFSFYWAQLAACKRGDDEADKGWATVNDKLRRTLDVPNTGMAVLYDIGEAKDIHPHNKIDVGKRLSLWALKNDYGIDIGVVSGPLYRSMVVNNNKIELEFDAVGSGLMVGQKHLLDVALLVDEPLKWFEIVGADGEWKPANAKIITKCKIEVYNPTIQHPIKVRYAWSGNPEGANLYNKEGLPAAVFTTEDE